MEARCRSPHGLTRFQSVVLLAAAGILGYKLFVPPVVGLADNGDFARVMHPAGLFHRTDDPAERYFRYLALRYRAGPPASSGYRSSEIPIAAAARFCATGLAPRGLFDIRYLGVLHALLFLGALALLLVGSGGWRTPPRTAFAVSLLFLFTDVGYVAPFNSFYTAAASLLFLMLLAGIVVCLAAGASSPALHIGFWLASLALVLSKPQEVVLAPFLALLGMLLAREGRGPSPGRALWPAAALCLAGFLAYKSTPTVLKSAAIYNHVFSDILTDTRDPRAALRDLGLPPEWIRYAGSNAFQKGSPLESAQLRKEFLQRVRYRSIVRFYLRHPGRLAERFERGAERSTRLRPRLLGNFAAESGARPFEESQAFGLWSGWKTRLAPIAPWLLPVFWLGNLAGALLVWRRSRDSGARCLSLSLVVLTMMAVAELGVCLLADSLADLERHLLTFNAMTDLALAADFAFLAAMAGRSRRSEVPAEA